ncbi:MAG: sorbosone dehydrogenase family protein [Bryobacteraceae bacterium]|nr:sorbosone dehydrogenase family protein [Bryobacteraceae bacterium]
MTKRQAVAISTCAAVAGIALYAFENQKAVDVQITGHVLRPEQVEATPERIESLSVPPGFRVSKFAEGLGKPRIIAVAEDGAVYVTRREPGDALLLMDKNGDGVADEQKTVARQEDMHGIAIHGDRVYLTTVKEVYVADRQSDGSLGELQRIIDDLPDGGQHPNRTLAVGPDDMLYITVGSTCNACDESNEENATLLRAQLDGSGREIFASGLRNTIGMDWRPGSNELWGMDHGTDWLGDDQPKEELNLIEAGQRYGWPFVYGRGKFDYSNEPPGGVTHEEWARKSREPALLYTAHAAPMQMLFYDGDQFPEEYRNDAFVTMRGSWNRKPPSGYEVVRIRFQDGKPQEFEPFLTGFLVRQGDGWTQFGRPVGLAVAADGALLIGDDTNGVIYRVSHEGRQSSRR